MQRTLRSGLIAVKNGMTAAWDHHGARHAVTLLHTVMVGGVFLVLEGWSLRGLTRASQEALEDVSGSVGSDRFGPNP